MKRIVLPILALCSALLGSGCVAIPMGTETFATDYPADVVPTAEPPNKSYKVEPVVSAGDENHRSVVVGIKGVVTTQQSRKQTFAGVEVVKKKRLAIGLFPMMAKDVYHPEGALTPISTSMYYVGNGRYTTDPFGSKEPRGAMDGGKVLMSMTLGLLPTPFSMMAGIFGPFEHDNHFLGGTVADHTSVSGGNVIYNSSTYKSEDIDLLLKFPMSEREKIGAWTYHENASHPHNTFWHGFEAQWFGVYKYCNYFVKDLGVLEKTVPAAPEVNAVDRIVSGPYSVVLSMPDIGFLETAEVSKEAQSARFSLPESFDGRAVANGTVRFLPPVGGFSSIGDEDMRALLERAAEHEWSVSVLLPTPVGGKGASSPQETVSEPYGIESIEPGEATLVVRVVVNDTSKTFEIDRKVRPEARRMFREQFATGPDAERRESVRMAVEDGGKSLVYTVQFE